MLYKKAKMRSIIKFLDSCWRYIEFSPCISDKKDFEPSQIALIIDNLNHDASLSDLLNPTGRINRLLKRYREKEQN